MTALLDDIYTKIPGVTVILSTLLPKAQNNACASFISSEYRSLVTEYAAKEKRIGLADINPKIQLDMLVDGTHPNDAGYKIFAEVWTDAIMKLEAQIQTPLDSGPYDSVPDKVA
jgi:muramidase (phage lysozyme)